MTTHVLLPVLAVAPATRPTVALTVWLADLTCTQQTISAETMPQAVAGLATYAATKMDLAHPVRVFKYPESAVGPGSRVGRPSAAAWNAGLYASAPQVSMTSCRQCRMPYSRL